MHRTFASPKVLIPTSLTAGVEVQNGCIAFGKTRFGDFEKLKKEPGVTRVRSEQRKAFKFKEKFNKTNQGKIKTNGLTFDWVGEPPEESCDNL